MKINDRSDSNPNTGVIIGRTDLSQDQVSVPTSAPLSGSSAVGTVIAKAQAPVIARPVTARPMTGLSPTTLAQMSVASVEMPAVVDRRTNRLATGPAISNPAFGFRNGG